jgi:transcriptional regulator with XRE-family HTH domain
LITTLDLERHGVEAVELMGSRLRRLREAAGLSQRDVAERLGVSQQAVGKWERENDPGARWLELAALYGITERYPDAPFNPERRRAWLQDRQGSFRGSRDAAVSSRRS